MPETLASAIASDGHPRDLGGLVETALPRQEAHDLASELGDEPIVRSDRVGAVATATFVAEVVRESQDDAVARLRVVRR
jgi:hypothetical protein